VQVVRVRVRVRVRVWARVVQADLGGEILHSPHDFVVPW
jgi:hypothetical protein